MSRPHEDRERHTLVDHHRGGPAVAFSVGGWLAIGTVRVAAERNDACISAYETLIDEVHRNVHAGLAVIFASENARRVVTMVGLRGHEGFGHLKAAWDDHHRFAQHRAMSESEVLELFTVGTSIGAADIDPASSDAYVFERIVRPVAHVSELFASLSGSSDFRAATIFNADGGAGPTILLLRFAHIAAYDVFRHSRGAATVLGAPGANAETHYRIHPRKTIPLS